MSDLNIIVRVDGGPGVGLGHLRRCVNLGHGLRRLGAAVRFVVSAHAERFVEGSGLPVTAIAPAADRNANWLDRWRVDAIVADSYEFDSDFLARLRERAGFLVAIDDLADRDLPADVVVNGAACADQLRYRALACTRFLLGPQYLLLREGFSAAPPATRTATPGPRILLTLGGCDWAGLTQRLMRAVLSGLDDVALDVVIGPFFTTADVLERSAEEWGRRVRLHHSPDNLQDLMREVAVAVSAGGQTVYELAASGTPAVCVCVAENQRPGLVGLAEKGTLILSGDGGDPAIEQRVASDVRRLLDDAGLRRRMGSRARALVDGRGVERVAACIVDDVNRRQAGAR